MEEFKNKDGTYNGAEMLSSLSGMPKDIILQDFERLKELKNQGYSHEERLSIMRKERTHHDPRS